MSKRLTGDATQDPRLPHSSELCPVCDEPWADHPGVIALCQEIQDLQAENTNLITKLMLYEREFSDARKR